MTSRKLLQQLFGDAGDKKKGFQLPDTLVFIHHSENMIVFIYWVYIVLALSSSLGARTGIKQLTQILSPKKSLGNCKADTGATLADIESLKAKTIPKTKTGRCFMECLFNTANIMKDGKFDKNGMVIAFTPALKGDLTKMGKLKELSEVCAKEIGPNKHKNCEGGQKFVECLAKHGNSYGLAFSTSKNM